MRTAPLLDMSAIPAAQCTAVRALLETVTALTEITQRQSHPIAKLNHVPHGTWPEKLTEDERPLAFEDLPIALAEVRVQIEHLAAKAGDKTAAMPALKRIIAHAPSFGRFGFAKSPAGRWVGQGGIPSEARPRPACRASEPIRHAFHVRDDCPRAGSGRGITTTGYLWAFARERSEIAAGGLRRIAEIFAVAAVIRGSFPRQRLSARRVPLVRAFGDWLQAERRKIPARRKAHIHPKSLEWAANLPAQWQSIHHESRSASLIETCKINGVVPFAYIKATLTAIADGHPQSRLEELLPWNFTPPSHPAGAAQLTRSAAGRNPTCGLPANRCRAEERWHQTMKNRVLLESDNPPDDLEHQFGAFVGYENNQS